MSSQDAQLNVILELKAKVDEMRRAQQAILDVKDSVESVNTAASVVGKGFVSGLGIGGALSVVGALKSAISEVVGEMKSLVSEGLNVNKSFETAQIGIAGALRNFLPERFKTFSQALSGAGTVVDELKKKSADLGISFESLGDQYRATVGAMLKGGVFDLQKQIDLTATLQRTMTAFGISGARATRDIVDILNGSANRTVIAKELGLRDAEINAAKDRGELYEFLTSKLQGFKEAADASKESLAGLEQRYEATKAQVAAESTQNLSTAYKGLLVSLTDLVKSDGFRAMAKFLGDISTDVVKKAQALTQAFTINDPNKGVGQGVKDVSSSLETVTTKEELNVLRARATIQRRVAQKALQDFATQYGEGYRESSAGKAESNAFAASLLDANDLIKKIDAKGQELLRQNQAKKEQAATEEADARSRLAQEAAAKWLAENGTKYDVLAIKAQLVGTKDEQRLAILNQIIDGKDEEYGAAADAARSEEEFRVVDIKAAKELLPLLQQRFALEQKLGAEKEREAKRTEKLTQQDAARTAIQQAKDTLDDIDAKKAEVQNDRYKTRLEKEKEIFAILQDEPAAIDDIIASLEKLSANTTDESAQHSIDNEVAGLRKRRKKVPAEAEKVAPQTTGQEVDQGFTRLKDGFVTVGQSIAGVMGSAIGSISEGLQGLFYKTESLGQATRQVFIGIGQSAVKAVTDMAAQWLVQHTFMAAISAAFHAGDAAGHVTTEAVKTGATVAGEGARTGATAAGSLSRKVIHLGETIFHGVQVAIRTAAHIAGELARTAVSVVQAGIRIAVIVAESLAAVVQGAIAAFTSLAAIPYVGPFLGAAAMAAFLIAGGSLVSSIRKNFADGGSPSGYVSGPGGPRSDRIPVNVSNSEYILNGETTNRIGKARLDAMNFGGASPYDVFAPVGSGGPGGSSSGRGSGGGTGSNGGASAGAAPTVINLPQMIVVDSEREAKRIANTTANEVWYLRMKSKHG